MVNILLDDIESTCEADVELRLRDAVNEAEVNNVKFTKIYLQARDQSGICIYSAHVQFDSIENARTFTKLWTGFDADDEELDENMLVIDGDA